MPAIYCCEIVQNVLSFHAYWLADFHVQVVFYIPHNEYNYIIAIMEVGKV